MQEASRQARLANSEFKAATAGLGMWSKSADGLTAKVKQLDTVLGAEKTKLASLEKQYELTAKEQGENSKGAKELAIQLNNQRAIVGETQSKLNYYEEQLEDCKNGTGKFADEMDDANRSSKKASDGFTVMKGALASLVADGIKLAVQGLKDLGREAVEAYKEFDVGRDNVIKATGATGEAADKLVKSYSNVAQNVKGEFDAIGSALGEVNTRFGFTGDQLETTTEDFVKFAEITGTDATTAVQLVSRAMGDAGIDAKDYKGLLDELAVAAQASGISIDGLTEMITKYGAPMRALGFSTKESIALFSAWEKAGVNTEIAFSGMKKAISNWGKANKDPKEEFKKTLEEIKRTPNIAKATTKAIEVFGAKAGPDLADAIKGGRFEYADFVELLDNSKGAVKNTYAETQDGFDKVQLAVQNARMKLAELVNGVVTKYQPQIEQFISSAVNGFDGFLSAVGKLFKFIIENGDTILSVLKSIAVAFITYQVVSTIMSVIATFQKLKVAIEAGNSVMKALNLTMAASPVGLIAAAIAGLTAAVIFYTNSVEDAIQKEYGLNEAQKKSIEKTNEARKAYLDMDKARDEANSAIDSEYDHLRDLKDEYNSLIGSNGKVKKGYEDRAEFILNELAKSMGIERSEIQKLIDKNGKLGKSIDNVILKKQAEATLNANEDEYKKAIDKKTEALKDYQNKQEEVEKAQKKVNKAEKELKGSDHWAAKDIELLDGAVKKYKEYQKQVDEGGWTGTKAKQALKGFKEIYGEEGAAYIAAKASLDEMNSAYKKAESTYVGYNSTIKNYEGLSAAIISGDAKKIKTELANIQNDFISAKNGTANTLSQQVTDFQNNYNTLKEAVKNGMAGVSQADVTEAKKLLDNSKKELVNYFNKSDVVAQAKKNGLAIPKSLAEGIKSGKIDIDTATKNIQSAIDFSKSDAVKKANKLGIQIPKSLSTAIMSGKTSVADASKRVDAAVKFTNMNKNAKGQAKKTVTSIVNQLLAGKISAEDAGEQLKKAGLKGMSGGEKQAKKDGTAQKDNYVKGVKSDPKGVQSAGKTLPKNAKKGADTKDKSTNSESSGKNFLQGFLDGLLNATLLGKIFNAGKGAAKKGKDGLKKGGKEGSPWKTTLQSGEWFMEGFINGIQSLTGEAFKTAFNVGSGAVTSLQDAQEEHSPSKITYKSGVNFTKGYIKGIVSEEKTLVTTMKNLVKSATTELLKLNNFNFSEVASNASSVFSDRISKQISYTTDKIAYNNEKKLAEFDKTIANYEKKQAKKEKLQDKAKNAKSKAARKKAKDDLKKYNKDYKKLISQQEKAKEAYQSASSEMLEEFNSALSEYQSKAQKLINDTINGITSKYQARYDELINKQNTLIDKLKSAGNLFDISGAGVITVNDIKQQTQNIKDYVNKLETIKNKVSSDLFDKIASYDMEQGNAFMDQLLALSDADLKAYSDAYDEKMQVAESLAENLYKNDFKDVADEYAKEIKDAMAKLPKQLEELGMQVMQGFVSGLTKDTDYMSSAVKTLVKGMVDTFKSELKINSPSKVTEILGQFTGVGFADGIKNTINKVKEAANSLVNASSQSLEGVKSSIDTARANVGNANNGVGGTNITNNYNLVQNNTSPKSLSALETYKARQRQLAMVKAATQNS